jgi:GTPase SAR1 family protein
MANRKMFKVTLPNSTETSSEANETKPTHLERIAINPSGSIGNFYNGYEDIIGEQSGINCKPQLSEPRKGIKCELIQGRTAQSQNLLEFVDIDHQLRLSIRLEMFKPTGIASVINYPRLIDKNTRFLYLYQESRIESCHDELYQLKNSMISPKREAFATHIITEIVWGIHLLVILQLSPDHDEDIDTLLWGIQENLSNNELTVRAYAKDRSVLDHIISTTVYSNIPDLTEIERLGDICNRITDLQNSNKDHQPIRYGLTPILWFTEQYASSGRTFISSEPEEVQTLECYLIQQSCEFKRLDLQVNRDLRELLEGKFTKKFKNIQEKLSQLYILQIKDTEKIRDILLSIRKGELNQSYLDKEVSLDPPKEIRCLIEDIIFHIEQLKSRRNLFKKLENDKIELCNVSKLGIREGLNEERVKDILFGNDLHKIIFFSNDDLRNNDEETWTRLYSRMIKERNENSQLRLVYADFTSSTYKLKKMDIFLSPDMTSNDTLSDSQPSPRKPKRKAPAPPPPSTNEYINILLIGESGVGKSTFINAFANYLRFESLEAAQQGEPIVIIPVSFLMTVNDNFDERVIKFGSTDSNENHNDYGQSVTQRCKSYVFKISDEKKLRIIDTPGFGDTRGFDQDDFNMEEIFSFLNNLTYLNGICLLFKPEVVQLNPYLRSCCTQLFEYFGKNICDSFIFCFTNARSTFFAPGNTRPLLKTFFDSFPEMDIPLKKSNTFCFDSESFRYLVAIQNEFVFDSSERGEFEQSWIRSVSESKRFRNFLIELSPYRKTEEWQSIKDAQFQINSMVRPMLEAMRNLQRNILLYNVNSSVKLDAIAMKRPTMFCYKCNRKPAEFGEFWILPDYLHNPSDTVSSML